jgi:hypothetical protein
MCLMDHDRAVETQAIERYLLGEMPEPERGEFEEHYFSCMVCAEEIRTASRFRDAARQVAREPRPVAVPKPRWEWWKFPSLVPVAASAALFGTVIYLAGFEIPALRSQLNSGQSIAAISLRETTRGAQGVPVIPPGRGFFTVYFDLPPGSSAASYRCTVTDAAGNTVDVISAAAPRSGEPMNLLLNRSRMSAGVYTITVQPSDAANSNSVLSRFHFQL